MKTTLTKELESLDAAANLRSLDETRLKREIKARLANMRGLLARHVSSARRLLKTLLVSPLRLETVPNGDRWRYRILGTGSYLPLLENAAEPLLPTAGVPNGIGGLL